LPEKGIAAFLGDELWVFGGAKEEVLTVLGGVMEGAGVLDIGDAFGGHAAFAEHGEISLTKDLMVSDVIMAGLSASWVFGDIGFGVEVVEDIGEDFFGVEFGVGENGLRGEAIGKDGVGEQRDGLGAFGYIGGEGGLEEGDFGGDVSEGMVAVSPEVIGLF